MAKPVIEGLDFKQMWFTTDYEIDALIEKHFGKKWCHQQNGDMVANDTFDRIFISERDDWTPEELAEYKEYFKKSYNIDFITPEERVEKWLADDSPTTEKYYFAGREDYVYTSNMLHVLRSRGVIPADIEEIWVWVSW